VLMNISIQHKSFLLCKYVTIFVCLLSREGGTSLLGSGSSDPTRQEFAQGKVIIFLQFQLEYHIIIYSHSYSRCLTALCIKSCY